MFLLKKLVGALATPLALTLLLSLVALGLYWRNRTRSAVVALSGAVIVLYFGSIDLGSDLLLGPLERAYPPLLDDRALPSGVEHVVVLGSSFWPERDAPITGELDSPGLTRAVEGVRLFRQRDLKFLVVSGGRVGKAAPSAAGYSILARSLGVNDESIIVLDKARDTGEEAQALKAVVGESPYILVTSAAHMQRSMQLMERAGMHPIAAPTGHFTGGGDGDRQWQDWLPDGDDVVAIERALHEYVGLLALKIGIS